MTCQTFRSFTVELTRGRAPEISLLELTVVVSLPFMVEGEYTRWSIGGEIGVWCGPVTLVICKTEYYETRYNVDSVYIESGLRSYETS